DFYLLSRCDIVAYCNSSRSLMAALLASPEQEAYIIDFGTYQFLPFDPWNETWFWGRFRPIRDLHDQNVAFLADVAGTRQDLESKVVQLGVALEKSMRTLDETRQETTRLRTRLTAIEASTIWRATQPLRMVATRMPAPIRRHLRQIAKAGYWMMTPHKIPA